MQCEQRLSEEEVEHDHCLEGDNEIGDVARGQNRGEQDSQDIDGDDRRVRETKPSKENADERTDYEYGITDQKIEGQVSAASGVPGNERRRYAAKITEV